MHSSGGYFFLAAKVLRVLDGWNDEKCERSTLRRHVRGVVGRQVRQFVPSDGVFWYFSWYPTEDGTYQSTLLDCDEPSYFPVVEFVRDSTHPGGRVVGHHFSSFHPQGTNSTFHGTSTRPRSARTQILNENNFL